MCCIKRENTGSCSHYQCPFADETEHGYECVEIFISQSGGSFCEVGENCVEQCEYSFKPNDGSVAQKAAAEYNEELKEEFGY